MTGDPLSHGECAALVLQEMFVLALDRQRAADHGDCGAEHILGQRIERLGQVCERLSHDAAARRRAEHERGPRLVAMFGEVVRGPL